MPNDTKPQDYSVSVAIAAPLRKLFDYGVNNSQLPHCIPGARVQLNFRNRTAVGVIVEKAKPADGKFKLKPVEQILDHASIFNPDLWSLAKWASKYYRHPLGDVLFSMLPVLLRKGGTAALRPALSWQRTERALGLPADALSRAPKQQQCLQYLAQYEPVGNGELAEANISNAILKALQDKQLIETVETQTVSPQRRKDAQSIALNQEQQYAYKAIAASYQQPKVSLLFGVTGSGKTEVYIQLIRDQLSLSKQTLIIVPEINLTPQFVKRFEQQLGIEISAMHSGMTDRQRLDGWLRARSGEQLVILGTRSALFTPLKNPGLIIIDEEHSSSLKQQEGFRYSARDCAAMRSRHLNIPLVLGSATPAIESYFNAQRERYALLQLNQRAKASQAPNWQIQDIRGKHLTAGLSEYSLTQISNTIASGQHALVFINRLGFAPNLLCHNCGWHAQCQLCDANQIVFLKRQQLKCNQCQNQRPLPQYCPDCGSSELYTEGLGTEQVAAQLQKYFTDTPVLRMDSETTRNRGSMEAFITTLNTQSGCIIVGTQLMSKGHDFANLTLVVAINADESLVSTNYRASERTAQLLTQVAGRAGRDKTPGKVIIQTHYPELPLFEQLARNNYQAVLDTELGQREATALPPFSYEAQILATGKNPNVADHLLHQLKNAYQWSCAVSEPTPAIITRKSGQFRFTLLFRANNRQQLQQNIALAVDWLDTNAKSQQIRWSIDVDPAEFQ